MKKKILVTIYHIKKQDSESQNQNAIALAICEGFNGYSWFGKVFNNNNIIIIEKRDGNYKTIEMDNWLIKKSKDMERDKEKTKSFSFIIDFDREVAY